MSDNIKSIELEDDQVVVSFDVSAFYTNVPVQEAIQIAADRLYAGDIMKPPVNKETFIQLDELSSLNVIISTHDGYYRQVDGLAMGSDPAPHLANIWLNNHDSTIKGNAKLYERYMDDVLRSIRKSLIESKLTEINTLHPNFKFTIEYERDGQLPFLDLCIIHTGKQLSSTWYTKPTDTGLIMNFHAVAPRRYKRSVVNGFVHRIYRSCSDWNHFNTSLDKAKQILERNQYPPEFYDPVIAAAIEKLTAPTSQIQSKLLPSSTLATDNTTPSFQMMLQYRGRITDNVVRRLSNFEASVKSIITLRKLKTVLPSLKPYVPDKLKSRVVYQIKCPGCEASYVGYTTRHLKTRFAEHRNLRKPVGSHFMSCIGQRPDLKNDLEILCTTTRGLDFLETLEALFINDRHPEINTKDEYRSRTLTLKF